MTYIVDNEQRRGLTIHSILNVDFQDPFHSSSNSAGWGWAADSAEIPWQKSERHYHQWFHRNYIGSPKAAKSPLGLKSNSRKRTYSEVVDITAIETPPEHADAFEWVTTVEENIEVYRAWVYAPAFKRPIQVVYLVKITPTQFSEALLFCTDRSLCALNVYRYYKARFQIEFIFRDAKQFLGLTHCQARDSQKLDFHVNSVLMTLNVLKVHWANNQASASIRRPFSVANYKRKASNDYLL